MNYALKIKKLKFFYLFFKINKKILEKKEQVVLPSSKIQFNKRLKNQSNLQNLFFKQFFNTLHFDYRRQNLLNKEKFFLYFGKSNRISEAKNKFLFKINRQDILFPHEVNKFLTDKELFIINFSYYMRKKIAIFKEKFVLEKALIYPFSNINLVSKKTPIDFYIFFFFDKIFNVYFSHLLDSKNIFSIIIFLLFCSLSLLSFSWGVWGQATQPQTPQKIGSTGRKAKKFYRGNKTLIFIKVKNYAYKKKFWNKSCYLKVNCKNLVYFFNLFICSFLQSVIIKNSLFFWNHLKNRFFLNILFSGGSAKDFFYSKKTRKNKVLRPPQNNKTLFSFLWNSPKIETKNFQFPGGSGGKLHSPRPPRKKETKINSFFGAYKKRYKTILYQLQSRVYDKKKSKFSSFIYQNFINGKRLFFTLKLKNFDQLLYILNKIKNLETKTKYFIKKKILKKNYKHLQFINKLSTKFNNSYERTHTFFRDQTKKIKQIDRLSKKIIGLRDKTKKIVLFKLKSSKNLEKYITIPTSRNVSFVKKMFVKKFFLHYSKNFLIWNYNKIFCSPKFLYAI